MSNRCEKINFYFTSTFQRNREWTTTDLYLQRPSNSYWKGLLTYPQWSSSCPYLKKFRLWELFNIVAEKLTPRNRECSILRQLLRPTLYCIILPILRSKQSQRLRLSRFNFWNLVANRFRRCYFAFIYIIFVWTKHYNVERKFVDAPFRTENNPIKFCPINSWLKFVGEDL